MSVPFRFDTVLKIRETERDASRQAFAKEQARESTLRVERDCIADERLRALNERRALQATDAWTAEKVLTRQQHAEQLSRELACAETALSEATAQLTLRRQELLEADVAVKGLEKLSQLHQSARSKAEQANDEQDRDDLRHSWRAA